MIRAYEESDLDVIADIWLRASVKAHDFVDQAFWKSELDNMRNVYLPASLNYVYEQNGTVLGFYSLHEDTLAAIFVAPEHQRQGVGSALVKHAKSQRTRLSLTVYTQNRASHGFYLSHQFVVVREQTDPHTGQPEYVMKFETE